MNVVRKLRNIVKTTIHKISEVCVDNQYIIFQREYN